MPDSGGRMPRQHGVGRLVVATEVAWVSHDNNQTLGNSSVPKYCNHQLTEVYCVLCPLPWQLGRHRI